MVAHTCSLSYLGAEAEDHLNPGGRICSEESISRHCTQRVTGETLSLKKEKNIVTNKIIKND